MIGARDYALKLLSFKDRSEKEVRKKMAQKGYGEEETEETVAFCREYGFIDDERYAERFVHDASEIKKLGAARIKRELREKGIAQDITEKAVLGLENERETLASEIKRRFADADFSNPKEKNKVIGYFARRGFSVRDIIHAMGESEEEYFE